MKELFIAITLGAILGLVVTGGFVTLNKKNKDQNFTQANITPTVSVSPDISSSEENNQNEITLKSPQDLVVYNTTSILLKGITNPESTVIVTTPVKSYNFQTDKSGNFSESIDIDSGINIIDITSIDANDNEAKKQITVIYSTAKF